MSCIFYSKRHTLVSMVTSPAVVTVVKHGVELWDTLLQKYGFNFHITVAWLPNLSLDNPKVGWCRFCFHLRSSNFRRSKMVYAMELKLMASRSTSVASRPAKFYENVQVGWKVLRGGHNADRQTGDLRILPLFLIKGKCPTQLEPADILLHMDFTISAAATRLVLCHIKTERQPHAVTTTGHTQ
jgi:hypothetical protein